MANYSKSNNSSETLEPLKRKGMTECRTMHELIHVAEYQMNLMGMYPVRFCIDYVEMTMDIYAGDELIERIRGKDQQSISRQKIWEYILGL